MRQFTRAALLASAAATLASAPAIALESEAADAEPLDTIVVKATRTNLSAFDYPGLTSAIEIEALDREQPTDLADLLEDVPGVVVGGGARRTGQNISLRGFGRSNVALLLDGARQNFSSAHDGVLFLDPALLGRVETVRGAGSSLYGSGASGGVIAFETLRADDILDGADGVGVRAAAGYRSVNEESRGAAAVVGQQNRFDYALGLSARASGDIELGSGDTLPAEDRILSGFATFGAELTPGVRAELGWIGFENEAQEPNNGQAANLAGPGNALTDKTVEANTWRGTLGVNPADQPLIDFEAVLYRTDSVVEETEINSGRFIDRELDTTGLRVENRSTFDLAGASAALVVGGEWYEDEQTGFDSETADNTRGGVPIGSTTFYGAYVQGELTVGAGPLPGKVILVPGVRFDRFESESDLADANEDDEVSPRLSATWAPNDQFRVFGGWSQAFRAPSLNELYLSGVHFNIPHPILGAPTFAPNFFTPNPDLTPETSQTVELGAAFSQEGVFGSGDRLEIKGALFRTKADDLISLQAEVAFDPTCFAPPFFSPCSSGVSFSENVADAELTGYELAASYETGPWSLDGAVYRVDGEDVDSGEPLGFLQPVSGYARLRYDLDAWRTEFYGRAEFAGDFDDVTNPADERAGYVTLDLGAGFRPFADQPLRIDVEVENILDHDYDRVFAGVSEPGRSVRIDLRWSGAL